MCKHTPGPWWRDDDGFVAAGHGDTYVTVATANCSSDLDIDEREANTALIVNSPRMLDLLRRQHSINTVLQALPYGCTQAEHLAALDDWSQVHAEIEGLLNDLAEAS
jgi:hypothetical protein